MARIDPLTPMVMARLVALASAVLALVAVGPAAALPPEEERQVEIQSNAFAEGQKFPAAEAVFTPPIYDLPGHKFAGEVVHVGRGCPAGSTPEDPYLADPGGRIALIERGECTFDNKFARAQLAGAVGVIVYNHSAGGEGVLEMGGNSPATLPDGTTVEISIPGVFVARSVGLMLRDGPPPVLAQVKVKNRRS